MPIMALVHPVYDCLIRLAQPDALKNHEEVCVPMILCLRNTFALPVCAIFEICACYVVNQVDCLVLELHRIGDQLEKANAERMDELFFLLRDGFLLQRDLGSLARLLLLEILEFRAGGWSLSDAAQRYYYSEVRD